jgi:DNA polymerase III subunit delta'
MLWDRVVGHEAAKLSLRRAVEQGNVNHAYLFTGPQAVGKFMVARAFAAAVLCENGGCGECNTCRRVLAGSHPDVQVVRPAGKNIPVETIREIRMDAFKRPVEASRKIYIFKDVDRMWDEGASTMLKVLEEPPGSVVFILVTDNRAAVLPTIRSRCQEIRFANIPIAELSDYLVEIKGADAEKADLIARLSGGVLGRALDWCDEPWRLKRRDDVVRAARSLRRADLNRVLETAGELYGEVRAPLEELADRCQQRKQEIDNGSLDNSVLRGFNKEIDEELKREQIKEEIRGVREVLSTLSWWYRDILIFKEGGDASLLVNKDLQQEISEEAGVLQVSKLLRGIELIGESVKSAERNVPALLNIESTLLGLQEELYA